jgi:hypothetical protein
MGAVLTKKPRCADQEASAKKYGLTQVEAGKRRQRSSVARRAVLTKNRHCSAQDAGKRAVLPKKGIRAVFPDAL